MGNFKETHLDKGGKTKVRRSKKQLESSDILEMVYADISKNPIRPSELPSKSKQDLVIWQVAICEKIFTSAEKCGFKFLCRGGSAHYLFTGIVWRLLPSTQLDYFLMRVAPVSGIDLYVGKSARFLQGLCKQFRTSAYSCFKPEPIDWDYNEEGAPLC